MSSFVARNGKSIVFVIGSDKVILVKHRFDSFDLFIRRTFMRSHVEMVDEE